MKRNILPAKIEARLCRQEDRASRARTRRQSAIFDDALARLIVEELCDAVPATLKVGQSWLQRDVGVMSYGEVASEGISVYDRPIGMVAGSGDEGTGVDYYDDDGTAHDNDDVVAGPFDEYVWRSDPRPPRRQPSDRSRLRAFRELVRDDPTWFSTACQADDALMQRELRPFGDGTQITHVNPNILFGLDAIRREVSGKRDKALRSIDEGKLPIGEIGGRLCADVEMLRQAGKAPRKPRAATPALTLIEGGLGKKPESPHGDIEQVAIAA